jgi:hypothetical protein
MADGLLKGTDNLPSSTARPGASPPSYVLLPLGRRDRPPEVRQKSWVKQLEDGKLYNMM